jgi:hypothetical protein
MTTNPFQPTSNLTEKRGVFADFAVRQRSAFLYRVIDFERPFEGQLVYTGWWFRQAVYINGHPVWFRISWTKIHTSIAFQLPKSVSPTMSLGQLEIQFSRGLTIQRFRIWIDSSLVYDEIH